MAVGGGGEESTHVFVAVFLKINLPYIFSLLMTLPVDKSHPPSFFVMIHLVII